MPCNWGSVKVQLGMGFPVYPTIAIDPAWNFSIPILEMIAIDPHLRINEIFVRGY